MITVGCAGFPVPATRYFREFMFVEVQETYMSLPGQGTIRRWRREAPQGFRFALLGPREVGQEGFRDGKVIETALRSIEAVAEELEAKTAVFVAPPELAPTRTNKTVLRDFLADPERLARLDLTILDDGEPQTTSGLTGSPSDQAAD